MREVSSKATRMLLEILAQAGIASEPLVRGLRVTLDDLREPHHRIDWDLFAALCDRAGEMCEGTLTLEQLGARLMVVPSFEFVRRAGQLVVTPRQLYTVAERMMAPALFPNLTIRSTWLTAGRVVLVSEIAAEYRESVAFFRICHGGLVELPRLLDLPSATIEEQSVSGRRGQLTLLVPPPQTAGARIARGARAIFALGDALRGVARQQAELEAGLETLRASRHELRQLIERLPEGVLIHHGGTVRWANDAMIALLGYRTVEEVAGKNILDFITPAERAGVASEMARAAPRHLPEARLEYRILRPDRTERRLQAGATQYVEFEGESARLVVVRDVTEEYRLREQLALADRMASIGTVAAGVAHEINNPLAYVQTNLELALRALEGGGGPARMSSLAECLRSALEGAERVRGIVHNLRTLSRADEEVLKPVNLPALLDSTLALAQSALASKARVVRSYGAVPAALGAEGRLGQVFLNLLLNAADAIPDGAPERHEVRARTETDEQGRAVVEISDTGAGIPRELAGRVFEPFFTTKAIGAGTGLGLAICHRLVTDLGGEIAFTSSPGAGTTFRVVLPPARTGDVAPSEPPLPPRTRGRILVVDDEPALRRTLCMLLGDVHEVVAAASGRAALDVLARDPHFDAVLADLMMANLTGMELYEAVRTAHPGLERRIVFMTGGAFTARARDFLAHVPNRCLEKPFRFAELLATLGELVARPPPEEHGAEEHGAPERTAHRGAGGSPRT